MPVSTIQLASFMRGMELIDIRSRQDVRLVARCTLVADQRHLLTFDSAFDEFWRNDDAEPDTERVPTSRLLSRLSTGADNQPVEAGNASRSIAPSEIVSLAHGDEMWDPDDSAGQANRRVAVYSPFEALKEKDFAMFSDVELEDARAFLHSIEWTVAVRPTRRRRHSESGREIDVRKLLRRSLRDGGEVLDLPRRGHRTKGRHLVVLCDISGSMDRYARMLLHFLHAIESSFGGAEVFVFGTRLTRITHAIRRRSPAEAVSAVADEVHDWAGGTRIGEAIAAFNRTWSRRVAAHGAIVLIISDGWDRGDPDQLRAEIACLQRTSHRLIWLNPLLGSASYQPATRGMRAALPYIDDFLPAHNLASLQSLAVLLNSLPLRRQGRTRVGTLTSPAPPS